jgi:hypothetical protein
VPHEAIARKRWLHCADGSGRDPGDGRPTHRSGVASGST